MHASVSPALLPQVRQAANAEQADVDEFVVGAIGRRLNRRTLEVVLAFGKRHAPDRGT